MLDELNVICCGATAADYAFHPQKAYQDGTDVLGWCRHHCAPLSAPADPK